MDLDLVEFIKKFKKKFVYDFIAIIVLIVGLSSFDVIEPNERGIAVTLGKVSSDVIGQGVTFHAPFVTKIRTFRIEPKTYEVKFSTGTDGAITKDMQTVGTTVVVRWMYDASRIMDIVTTYRDDKVVELAMRDNVKASVKETTGKYSIYELVSEQNQITKLVADAVLERMKNYPIQISQTTITNWDWSDDFDKQIKETANRTQMVKQAEQEANIAEAKAQVKVREANANLEAEKLNAEANRVKAEGAANAKIATAHGEAQAKKEEADGIAYYNAKIAQNLSIQQQQWKHEEQMAYYSKWNGELVPAYIPLTAAGGIVNLKQ